MSREKLLLNNFRYSASIGCSTEERSFPQTVAVDLEIETDFTALLLSGNIEQGVDWAKLDEHLRAVITGQSWVLAEQLADKLALSILQNFGAAKKVLVRLRKFPFPHADSVAVEIQREC